jgi:hypothetical protein
MMGMIFTWNKRFKNVDDPDLTVPNGFWISVGARSLYLFRIPHQGTTTTQRCQIQWVYRWSGTCGGQVEVTRPDSIPAYFAGF